MRFYEIGSERYTKGTISNPKPRLDSRSQSPLIASSLVKAISKISRYPSKPNCYAKGPPCLPTLNGFRWHVNVGHAIKINTGTSQ